MKITNYLSQVKQAQRCSCATAFNLLVWQVFISWRLQVFNSKDCQVFNWWGRKFFLNKIDSGFRRHVDHLNWDNPKLVKPSQVSQLKWVTPSGITPSLTSKPKYLAPSWITTGPEPYVFTWKCVSSQSVVGSHWELLEDTARSLQLRW